jgi:hypothetical protein
MQYKDDLQAQKTTLMHFVEQNCDNLFSGECIGVKVNGNQLKRNSKTTIIHQYPYEFIYPNAGLCWIQGNLSCDYFKRIVLCNNGNKAIAEEYGELCRSIEKQEPRYCECGTKLVKRSRYCSKCKTLKRKKAYRKYNRNRKVVIPQLT